MVHTKAELSRRSFVTRLAVGGLASCAAPRVVTAKRSAATTAVVGSGEHRYEVEHMWGDLPRKFTWQTTHNVAVDKGGLVYVIHEGRVDQPEHPSVLVFDEKGAFVRAFGEQFQGGGHGLEVRQEGGDEFLYVTAYQTKRSFAKLTLTGDVVWHKFAPMEAGIYADGEDVHPRKDNPWGRNRFLPTNFAFHPTDGGFYLADGYGGWCIHRYDKEGNWQSKFGSPSDATRADSSFDTPHGVWIDNRGSEPLVVVADRANGRLQWFTLEGVHQKTQEGFLLPANVDVRGDVLLVPDLVGRVTLLGPKNEVIAHLGDDHERIASDAKKSIRQDESAWIAGKFVHPHDACFDSEGNIYVAEWVARGRVSKLRRLS